VFFYLLYLIGYGACRILPRRVCYADARRAGDFQSSRSPKDREAVRANLEAVLGKGNVSEGQVREVFRNFAMYLVDFFRFGRLTPERIGEWVEVEGLENMREVLSRGRGAIGVTAHLGNFELAAAVLSMMGLPVHGIVMTHQNPWVDRFFTGQREKVGVTGIPIQRIGRKAFLETALSVLRRNQILGLVADRDFFDHGLELPWFGRLVKIPTGPAAFSVRTGAPIVPSFLVREPDGRYRFFTHPPIEPPAGVGREEAIRRMTQDCLDSMGRAIRRYPTQWYMFQEFWRAGPAFIR